MNLLNRAGALAGRIRIATVIPLLIVLGVAAFLRLYRISEYMTFLGDEGRDVIIVRKMLIEGDVPFLGPTASVGGFFLGPLYYYLMAPFLWLWNYDPTGPAVMVALFGVATVYLVYRFTSEAVNPFAGLVAASVYSLSPLVIAYSRSSWNPNLVPFTTLLLIYLLWRFAFSQSRKTLFGIGILLGVGLQFHYLFLFLFITAALWVLYVTRFQRVFQTVAVGVTGFIVGHAPFLAFELKNGFPNTRSIIRFVSSGEGTGFSIGQYIHTVYDVFLRFFGRLLIRMPQEEIWLGLYDARRWVWEIPIWLLGIAAVVAIARFVLNKDVKQERRAAAALLLMWFFSVVLLFGFYTRAVYDYYFGILFPFPFIGLGYFLWWMARFRFGNWVAILLWGGLLWWNALGHPFQFVANNQLGQMRKIAESALSLTDGKLFNFALVTNFNSDHAYRYFFEVAGRKPVVIENAEKDPERKTVTNQLIVICEIECQPLGHPLWEIAGFGRAEVDKKINVPFVTIYRLIRYNSEDEIPL